MRLKTMSTNSHVQIFYVSSKNFLRLLLGNQNKNKNVFTHPHAQTLYVSSSYPLLMIDNHNGDKNV